MINYRNSSEPNTGKSIKLKDTLLSLGEFTNSLKN